jgi:hypothetical protein
MGGWRSMYRLGMRRRDGAGNGRGRRVKGLLRRWCRWMGNGWGRTGDGRGRRVKGLHRRCRVRWRNGARHVHCRRPRGRRSSRMQGHLAANASRSRSMHRCGDNRPRFGSRWDSTGVRRRQCRRVRRRSRVGNAVFGHAWRGRYRGARGWGNMRTALGRDGHPRMRRNGCHIRYRARAARRGGTLRLCSRRVRRRTGWAQRRRCRTGGRRETRADRHWSRMLRPLQCRGRRPRRRLDLRRMEHHRRLL